VQDSHAESNSRVQEKALGDRAQNLLLVSSGVDRW